MMIRNGVLSLKKARFFRFSFNQLPVLGGPEGEFEPLEKVEKLGAFKDNHITVAVADGLQVQVNKYQFVDSWSGEEFRQNIVMPAKEYEELREALKRYSPIYLDLTDDEIFLLRSAKGCITELLSLDFKGAHYYPYKGACSNLPRSLRGFRRNP